MDDFTKGFLYGDSLRKANDLVRKDNEIQDLKNKLKNQQTTVYVPQHILPASEIKAMQEKIAFYENSFALQKQAFEKQQETIATWMLSQKAIREVAYKLAKELGKAPEEVKNEIMLAKQKVVDNTTEFDNNSNDTPFLKDYLQKKKV